MVYYYQSYDQEGRRLPGRSTGKSNKTAARAYCDRLLAEGFLFNGEQTFKIPLFKDFAKGWWDFETCEYVRGKAARDGGITKNYVKYAAGVLKNYVLPKFGNVRLNKIDEPMVYTWLTEMAAGGLRHSTTTSYLVVLSTMLGFAKFKKYIKYNPCIGMERLANDAAEPEILTDEEVNALFPDDWSSIWDDYNSYLAAKMAAHTGMRFSEVLGLKADHVYEGYIHVEKQYNQSGYVKVKTKRPRYITLPPSLEAELREYMAKKDGDFIFTHKNKTKPVSKNTVYTHLYNAFAKIDIDGEKRKERHLSFHGFRHYFNTFLLNRDIAESKVMAMTGHLSRQSKERYTHFDTRKFEEVRAAQEAMLKQGGGNAPDGGGGKEPLVFRPLPPNVMPFRLLVSGTEQEEPEIVTAGDVREKAAVSE
jgi:integrase